MWILCLWCVYLWHFCLGPSSDYFPIQPQLTVFITEMECLLRGTNWMFKYNSGSFLSQKAVSKFRRLVAGLSSQRLGFDPRGQSMWDLWWANWHWERGIPPSTSVFLCQRHSTDSPPHLHLHVALNRTTNGWSLGTLHNEMPLWEPNRGALNIKLL